MAVLGVCQAAITCANGALQRPEVIDVGCFFVFCVGAMHCPCQSIAELRADFSPFPMSGVSLLPSQSQKGHFQD